MSDRIADTFHIDFSGSIRILYGYPSIPYHFNIKPIRKGQGSIMNPISTGLTGRTFVKNTDFLNGQRKMVFDVIGIGKIDGRVAIALRKRARVCLFVVPATIDTASFDVPYLERYYQVTLERIHDTMIFRLKMKGLENDELKFADAPSSITDCILTLSDESVPIPTDTGHLIGIIGGSKGMSPFVIMKISRDRLILTTIPHNMILTTNYQMATVYPDEFALRLTTGTGFPGLTIESVRQ